MNRNVPSLPVVVDLPVAGDRIVDGHRGVGDRGAGGIDHGSFNGAGVAERLAKRGVENDCTHEERTQSEGQLHVISIWEWKRLVLSLSRNRDENFRERAGNYRQRAGFRAGGMRLQNSNRA